MDAKTEITIKEMLFYAECELQAMIAENKQREHRGESMAYTENQFINLAEQTRLAIRNYI